MYILLKTRSLGINTLEQVTTSLNSWYKAGWIHAFMFFKPNSDPWLLRPGNILPFFYYPIFVRLCELYTAWQPPRSQQTNLRSWYEDWYAGKWLLSCDLCDFCHNPSTSAGLSSRFTSKTAILIVWNSGPSELLDGASPKTCLTQNTPWWLAKTASLVQARLTI